jgi:hypothetical protein
MVNLPKFKKSSPLDFPWNHGPWPLPKEIDGEVNRPLAMPVVALQNSTDTTNHGDDSDNLIDTDRYAKSSEVWKIHGHSAELCKNRV